MTSWNICLAIIHEPVDLQNIQGSRTFNYDAESEVIILWKLQLYYNLNLDIGLFLRIFRSAYLTSSSGSWHLSAFCGLSFGGVGLNYLKWLNAHQLFRRWYCIVNKPHYISWLRSFFPMFQFLQVLKFNLTESGLLCVLPWLTMAIFANLGGWIADTLVSKGFSITSVRKART